MKIGIPRAFLYFKYARLWESFFEALGADTIVSPDTNKDIVSKGMNCAVDECCLSSKIYLGHVAWLLDRCDTILVPRISNFKTGTVCTRFQAAYDVVKNTFRDRDIQLLHYNIDLMNSENELGAFMKMGKTLGRKKPQILIAYLLAKQAEKTAQIIAIKEQEAMLNEQKKIKVLLIAHAYNILDKYIGAPVIRVLQSMDVVPVIGEYADKKEAVACSMQLSDTLPWVYNKELLGSVVLYRDRVDGIILMSTFPCGPDSLVNEIIIRRVQDKPILNLLLDGQEGTAGLETRLESFVDIIRYKKEDFIG